MTDTHPLLWLFVALSWALTLYVAYTRGAAVGMKVAQQQFNSAMEGNR